MAKKGKALAPDTVSRIKDRYEAGVAVSKIAKEEGVSRPTIHRYINREGWEPSRAAEKKREARKAQSFALQALDKAEQETKRQRESKTAPQAASRVLEGRQAHLTGNGSETCPTMSGENPTETDNHRQNPDKDATGGEESIPDTPALSPAIAHETGKNVRPSVIEEEIARSALLLAQHQKEISRARNIGRRLLEKIDNILENGQAEDVVTVKTKQGVEVRLPFLGRNESLSDALIKVSSAMQKLIPLERQANSLKDDQAIDQAGIVINIGGFDTDRQESAPAIVVTDKNGETEPTSLRERVAHLDGD